MVLFFLNIALAGVFMLLSGAGRVSVFLLGFALGYVILWLSAPLYPDTRYFQKLPRALNLTAFFFRELLVSNIRVLWDILTPGHIHRPGIIGVPLSARTDLEIFIVAGLISLTPGTLSLDLSEDRKILYVHVMFLDDPQKARASIQNGLEKKVLEVMRA